MVHLLGPFYIREIIHSMAFKFYPILILATGHWLLAAGRWLTLPSSQLPGSSDQRQGTRDQGQATSDQPFTTTYGNGFCFFIQML